MRDADRVGDLDLAAVGQAGRDDVLGHVAGRVGGRAVDLARVLARERAAAVAGHAAVGVDDDLAAGEARVADRAADDEAGRSGSRGSSCAACARRRGRAAGSARRRAPRGRPGSATRRPPCAGSRSAASRSPPAGRRGSGRRPASCRPGAGTGRCPRGGPIGEAVRELVRERDRQRHELVGLVARVAEHHALVAGAGDVERVVVGRVGARLVRLVDALGDVGRLLVDRVDDGAGVGGEAEVGVGVADLADRLARDSWMSTYVVVEISPETTTRPVFTSVSHATRPFGSSRSTASRTPSEIWSAILSGWPSVTDSEVNRYSLSISVMRRESVAAPSGALSAACAR